MKEKTYIAIDLKSFYASVECADRHLDPLNTNLVVADLSRTEKTICLAVSPSLKAHGIPGRPRLFEVIQAVDDINRRRLRDYRRSRGDRSAAFTGASFDARELERDGGLELGYITATPHMSRYMEVSSRIFGIYLKYVSREDVIVYSIDEVFIDATAYLAAYGMTARELAMAMIREVLYTTGITATAGIGTNLYLAKIAMDIVAKHVEADADGVRMAELDERSYRHILWDHRPLTDFWRIGPGTARKLEENGMFTLGDVARMSVTDKPVYVRLEKPNRGESPVQLMDNGEELLYKLFGVNAELLIDHAWGWEPCTVDDVKRYKPESSSLGSGQVLHEPYSFDKARIIVTEMADELSLDLVRKGLVTDRVELYIGYDRMSLQGERGRAYTGEVTTDHYGRKVPKHAVGGRRLPFPTCSTKRIVEALLSVYDEKVDPALLVRRVNVAAGNILPESEARKPTIEAEGQLDLFTDYEQQERERKQQLEQLERERRLQQAVVSIKERFGKNALLKGTSYREGARARERNSEVGGHKA